MKALEKYNKIPVLLTFFIMGFCDVVGIATSYAKESFNLSESLAGFIPSMVFIWFLILAVPTALLMNKIGRKTTVQISNIITFVAMLIPLVFMNNFPAMMVTFVLLGIGNMMLQVSLNPLLTNVVKGEALTSALTAGQVIKAVFSFCGPFIALFAATKLGNWLYMFPIFAVLTLISWALLAATPIPEEEKAVKLASVGETFGLLKDKVVLLLFLGIFFVVGVDVGTNTVAPKLMLERAGWTVEKAGLAASVYFICRTVGAFLGIFMLAKVDEVKYFVINILAALVALVLLIFMKNPVVMLVGVGLIGFFCASIFSIIVSCALKARPEKANEISGFMITGVFGGAVIPPLMGFMATALGSKGSPNQTGSLLVIGCCILYLIFLAFWLTNRRKAQPAEPVAEA